MKRYLLVTFLVFAIAAITTAKGPMDKISVTIPNGQTIDFTDPEIIDPISMGMLEKFADSIPKPDVTANGYELARAFKDGKTYRIFDRVQYFPAGERGYVFYMGIENGWSEYDGKWFEASAEGVRAMKKIIRLIKTQTLPKRLSILTD